MDVRDVVQLYVAGVIDKDEARRLTKIDEGEPIILPKGAQLYQSSRCSLCDCNVYKRTA